MVFFSGLKRRPFIALSFHRVKLIKVLFFCFVVGLICGIVTVFLNCDEVGLKCCNLVKKFLNTRSSQPFILTCFCSFLSFLVPVFSIFVLGWVPISQVVFFAVPLFYGLGFGSILACLIVYKGFEGLIVFFLEVFPCALISILVLILSCKEAFRFANKTFKKLFIKKIKNINYRAEAKGYFIKFLTLSCFQLVASVLDGFCNFVFLKI